MLLPTFDALGQGTPPVVAAARRAEELGFDAVWAGDHLICRPPVLDSLCALSAAAAVTGRMVGRLRDELLHVLPTLLRGEPVDHPGPLAPVQVPGLRPAVRSPLPVSVGGRSDAALRRAARYGDQWMGIWLSAHAVRACARRLAALAAERGRAAPSVAMLVLVNVNEDADAARRGAAELVHGQYGMPLRVVERWTACGPAGTVAGVLGEYIEAGVSEFVLMPASADPLGQYRRLTAVRDLVCAAAEERRDGT